MLAACDLWGTPLFGLRYCSAGAEAGDALDAERRRQRELEARLQQAQLRLATLPSCAKPEPERHAEAAPVQPEPDLLKVPEKLAQLQGCWQSVKGDIPMVSADEKRTPRGNVRVCYCFGEAGQGQMRLLYTDGVTCTGPISGELRDERLYIDQPAFGCGQQKGIPRGLVKARVVCTANDAASECETETFGPAGTRITQQFQRVSPEHCGWRQ